MQLVAYASMLQDAVAAHTKTVLTLATEYWYHRVQIQHHYSYHDNWL